MRKSLCALGVSSIVCGLALAVLAPGAAFADTMSLRIAREAVQTETTQITYAVGTGSQGFVTLSLNAADVACASTPMDDYGPVILEPGQSTPPQSGAFSGSVSFTPIDAGAYVVCGWVTGYGEYEDKFGGPVFAATSLPISVAPWPHIEAPPPAPAPAPVPVPVPAPRACGIERLDDVITATIQATGISCRGAHGVVHAVEFTARDVPVSPYFTYSRSYGVSTPAGRFSCRREPFGLAGTEHNIRCKQGRVRVSWYTTHD
jgi:hypothetical protein